MEHSQGDRAQKPKSLYPYGSPPIFRLPEDIVFMILRIVIMDAGEISHQERARVQLVCRAFKAFVDLTPDFWTEISTHEPQCLWQQCLEKSGESQLAVTCDLDPETEPHALFLKAILPHAHRIRVLSCTLGKDSAKIVAEVAARAAPMLRDLRLSNPREDHLSLPEESIPFSGMHGLEELKISDLYAMWWQATGLRVVELYEVGWVSEISTFLDFLEASVQLESFYYRFEQNIYEQEALGPQTLPASHTDIIILPNLTHFTVYSIPAFDLQVILQKFSFPPDSYINATVADSFPVSPGEFDFVIQAMNSLFALRPLPSLTLVFNDEDAFLSASTQRWSLGFYNEGLDLNPRDQAYRTFFGQIPTAIRERIHSVMVVKIQLQQENAGWLVDALADEAHIITTFECPLDDEWLDALWPDESLGWAGFRLPTLQCITFNIYEDSTAEDIAIVEELLQTRSATMEHETTPPPRLDVTIRVPSRYDEDEIQAALEDPNLPILGVQIERIAATDSDGDFEEVEEGDAADEDDEELEEASLEDLDGDELML